MNKISSEDETNLFLGVSVFIILLLLLLLLLLLVLIFHLTVRLGVWAFGSFELKKEESRRV